MYLWPVKYRNSMKSTHKTHACKTKTNENTSKIMLAMSIVNEGPQGRGIDAAPSLNKSKDLEVIVALK